MKEFEYVCKCSLRVTKITKPHRTKSLRQLSAYGDAFQAINTGLQIAFPVYGVMYGVVDIGVSMYTGGTSLTSMIKTGIDSNVNMSYDF